MRRTVMVLVLVAILAACGGGSDSDGDSDAGASDADATLKIRDEAAELKAKAEAAFAKADDGQDLALGDTVRTNGTGFVQIDYRDGSLTRLDSNAEFTLTALSSTGKAQRVAGRLDGGRAWSNVEDLTSSEGSYEIETEVATAAVRGTLFNIDCTAEDGSCTFTVAAGTVVVTPVGGDPIELHAGDSITVHADHSTTTNPTVTQARLNEDAWVAKNLKLDKSDTGREPNGLPERAADEEASAVLDGAWKVTRTVTRSTNPLQPVGNVSEVTYTFTRNCTATACTLHLDAGGAFGASQQAVLSFAGDRFEGALTGQSPCRDNAGRELSMSPITGSIRISPVAGDPAKFTGVADVTIGASPGCGERISTFELAGQKS